MPTTTARYADLALDGLRRRNLDPAPLLQRAGIASELLRQPGARVHGEQMTRLIQGVWELLDDEFMGFTAQPCKRGCFAMACQLISHCENLEGLFRQGIRFYQLVTDDIRMRLEVSDQAVAFDVCMAHPERDPQHFYLEFWLLIWHRLASWFTGKQLPLIRAEFAYPEPAHAAEFTYIFPCECRFDQPRTRLLFSPVYLALPLVRTSRELVHFLRKSPADFMALPGEDDSLNLRIKTLLLSDFQECQLFPDFDRLIERLEMSPQAVRRRLKHEGTSFQRIKDRVRRDLAIEKLCAQGLSVTEVAVQLGYAEPRSFTRAFKQWTGVSPGAYREMRRE